MNQNEDHALSDKALRQALLRGLDKETYCNTLLEGVQQLVKHRFLQHLTLDSMI